MLSDGKTTKLYKPQISHKNLMAILKAISSTSKKILNNKQYTKSDLKDPLELLQYSIKSRAMVFVVSDFKNTSEEALKSLVALTKKCRVYCINVYDYVEEIPPSNGEYVAEYNGKRLLFNTM